MPATARLHILARVACLVACLGAWASATEAGEFAILPLRVALDRNTRSTEIVVRNDDKLPLRMQVEGMRWTQDEQGKDRYDAAERLLYFPKAMEIPPGESRIIRVGIKAAPVSTEETYRLFIEELPPAAQPDSPPQGASVQVFLRVGVPVFVEPAKVERKLESRRFDIRQRTAQWLVANTGNAHVRSEQVEIAGFAADGSRLFTVPSSERYFLAGVVKSIAFDIPADTCAKVAKVEASIVADNLDLKRNFDVPPGSCQ